MCRPRRLGSPGDPDAGSSGPVRPLATLPSAIREGGSVVTGSTKPGVVAYGDSLAMLYQVVGVGSSGDLPLVLTSGR